MKAISRAYLETQVQTASPERLHLMVVDAAIRSARQATTALEKQHVEAAFLALGQCRSCVAEILGGISDEPNPELAERLRALFVYVHRNLLYADLHRDPQRVREALTILESHRRTWEQLLERLQQVNTASRGPRDEGMATTSLMA